MNERGVDMCSVAVKIPDEVLYDTKMTEAEANAFAEEGNGIDALYTKSHLYWILCVVTECQLAKNILFHL